MQGGKFIGCLNECKILIFSFTLFASMKFVMFATAHPERYSDLFQMIRKMRIPDGIKVIQRLEIFGKPDVVVVFEARDEKVATDFVKQFGSVGEVTTLLAMDVR